MILVHGQTNYNQSANVIMSKKRSDALQWFSRGRHHFAVDKYTDKTPQAITGTLKKMFEIKKRTYKKSYTKEEKIDDGSVAEPVAELPSKPPGLFDLYVKDNFSKVQRGLVPGDSASDVMLALSSKWESLSNAEKEQLKCKNDELKEEYKQQVTILWQELTSEKRALLEETKGPKLRQLASARRELLEYPKKPSSPFLLFVQKNAKNVNASSVIERTKILGEMWKEMSANEKEIFFKENRKAQEQYNRDVAKWKETHPGASKKGNI